MRKSIVLLAALPALSLLGANATADDAPVRAAATKTVEVRDNFFSKAGSDSNLKSLRIRKDTIIKWVWGEDGQGTEVEHNVTCIKGNKCRTEDVHDARALPQADHQDDRRRVHDPPDDDEDQVHRRQSLSRSGTARRPLDCRA